VISKGCKFLATCSGRELAVILLQETEQKIDGERGHVEHVVYGCAELVVATEEFCFMGEVNFDRFLDAALEKRSMWRCIKEAVKIARLICDFDIEFVSWRPFDERQKPC
jgi:hypothetical protein